MKQFVITKKIAKHGSQSIIVIPRLLEGHLKPQTVVKLTIDIIEDAPNSASSDVFKQLIAEGGEPHGE